ncbi:metal ABC transporter solute-binding protein, Zn/Mn family [Thalassoglobus sp.]|uniref:metal ABC transporter solute-binding protein, Zn/Mn family n=1 Tax=Thalassoglobus sp. TaxID=2795869 RepID=UPI003AA986F6
MRRQLPKFQIVLLSAICLIVLTSVVLTQGCTKSSETNSPQNAGSPTTAENRISVVVTTGMVSDLVRHVAGDYADVVGLMGEGVDPHLFRPTSSDIGTLMKADLIIYSGLMLEGPMQPQFELARRKGRTVSAVADGLPKSQVRYPAGLEDHPDPHIWGDVETWAMSLDHVVRVLSEFDPKHADEYAANANAYRAKLMEVHEYAKSAIATIPVEQRYLVTAHDAFGYFSTAYEIPVKSVQGISTESEPGVQDINELVDFLVRNKVPAIFVESTVNAANIQAVVEGAKQQNWNVKIGGTLYSDSLGAPGTYEGTYIGMMDSNVTTIVKALGGKVPEKGLHGKLSLK